MVPRSLVPGPEEEQGRENVEWVCESLIKEVIEAMSSGLVCLPIKDVFSGKSFAITGISLSWEGQALPRVSKASKMLKTFFNIENKKHDS